MQWVQPRWRPGALVTPPHSSAAPLYSSSYFSLSSSFFHHALSYSVLMFPIVSFFSVGFILSSFFSFHLLLRRTFSSTFCNEELVSVMDIYLQQKLAERDDKYEYTYLEARVNWTILPTHSFLQLIAVITRIPDHHHIEPHTRVAYKLLEEHCSKV